MARILDQIDEKLLELLQVDGRLPLKALGAEVGLSTSAVQERIARLKAEGEILGFTIRRPDRGAMIHAFIEVTTDIPNCQNLAPAIARYSEVKTLDSISGKPEMIVLVKVPTTLRLQEIRDEIAALEHVTNVESKVSMKRRYERH